jgi:hypothetical protein
MPKLTERDRLAELEARQRKVSDEIEKTRQTLRDRYAAITAEMAVEKLTERQFRDVLAEVLRVGGGAALAALKGLSPGV